MQLEPVDDEVDTSARPRRTPTQSGLRLLIGVPLLAIALAAIVGLTIAVLSLLV